MSYQLICLACTSHELNMEPLGGIEPPTFALPRRRYTSKPQWQRDSDRRDWFNRGGVTDLSPPASIVMVKTGSLFEGPSRGRIAWYCAGLESPWDLSLASSNLALGAINTPPEALVMVSDSGGLIRRTCSSGKHAGTHRGRLWRRRVPNYSYGGS